MALRINNSNLVKLSKFIEWCEPSVKQSEGNKLFKFQNVSELKGVLYSIVSHVSERDASCLECLFNSDKQMLTDMTSGRLNWHYVLTQSPSDYIQNIWKSSTSNPQKRQSFIHKMVTLVSSEPKRNRFFQIGCVLAFMIVMLYKARGIIVDNAVVNEMATIFHKQNWPSRSMTDMILDFDVMAWISLRRAFVDIAPSRYLDNNDINNLKRQEQQAKTNAKLETIVKLCADYKLNTCLVQAKHEEWLAKRKEAYILRDELEQIQNMQAKLGLDIKSLLDGQSSAQALEALRCRLLSVAPEIGHFPVTDILAKILEKVTDDEIGHELKEELDLEFNNGFEHHDNNNSDDENDQVHVDEEEEEDPAQNDYQNDDVDVNDTDAAVIGNEDDATRHEIPQPEQEQSTASAPESIELQNTTATNNNNQKQFGIFNYQVEEEQEELDFEDDGSSINNEENSIGSESSPSKRMRIT